MTPFPNAKYILSCAIIVLYCIPPFLVRRLQAYVVGEHLRDHPALGAGSIDRKVIVFFTQQGVVGKVTRVWGTPWHIVRIGATNLVLQFARFDDLV